MIPDRYQSFYGDQTRWFTGEVVDVNDPVQLGRIKVRIYGIHGDNTILVPDEDLPWAQVLAPITEGGTNGLGNPLGIQVGALVFGIFLDGQSSQLPLIFGSIPKYEDLEEENDRKDKSVSPLARGINTIEKTPDEVIGEPQQPYNAKYPLNYVHQTARGHVIEIDDSHDSDGEGNIINHERIHIYHRSGTFIEMHPNGDVVTHHKNGWRSVTGNDKLHVTGDLNILVDGHITIDAKTINLNNGDPEKDKAARTNDTVDTGDAGTGSHFDTNSAGTDIIETGSSTVFIGG